MSTNCRQTRWQTARGRHAAGRCRDFLSASTADLANCADDKRQTGELADGEVCYVDQSANSSTDVGCRICQFISDSGRPSVLMLSQPRVYKQNVACLRARSLYCSYKHTNVKTQAKPTSVSPYVISVTSRKYFPGASPFGSVQSCVV